MIDATGRTVTYLRLSVTDRCDLRCRYCLGQDATFVPRPQVLSLEELERLSEAFIRLGIRKLRITGGEPLLRRGILGLIERLRKHVGDGWLDELTLTTNGTRLAQCADQLRAVGLRRVNVSLDALDPDIFRSITVRGDLARVLAGIAAAKAAGLKVKINTLALRDINEHQIDALIAWCGDQGHDMALIELMPLGRVSSLHGDHYLALDRLYERLSRRWSLIPSPDRSSGPARYFTVAETGRRLGFISPLTHGFCGDCNRLRVTCTGELYPCLGNELSFDLGSVLRRSESNDALERAITAAVGRKPAGHHFAPSPVTPYGMMVRNMNKTGG